jgi:tetratricopeptide (TPR) repeat protein
MRSSRGTGAYEPHHFRGETDRFRRKPSPRPDVHSLRASGDFRQALDLDVARARDAEQVYLRAQETFEQVHEVFTHAQRECVQSPQTLEFVQKEFEQSGEILIQAQRSLALIYNNIGMTHVRCWEAGKAVSDTAELAESYLRASFEHGPMRIAPVIVLTNFLINQGRYEEAKAYLSEKQVVALAALADDYRESCQKKIEPVWIRLDRLAGAAYERAEQHEEAKRWYADLSNLLLDNPRQSQPILAHELPCELQRILGLIVLERFTDAKRILDSIPPTLESKSSYPPCSRNDCSLFLNYAVGITTQMAPHKALYRPQLIAYMSDHGL